MGRAGCPLRMPKPPFDKKQLYKLAVAMSDLANAKLLSEYLVNEVKDMRNPLWVPLQDAAIVTYARPFTANKPYGTLKKKWVTFESEKMSKLHDNLIDLRNTTIAHSDAGSRKVIIVPPGSSLGPTKPTDKVTNVATTTQKLPPQRFEAISALCQFVGKRIYDEVKERVQEAPEALGILDRPFDLLTEEPVE